MRRIGSGVSKCLLGSDLNKKASSEGLTLAQIGYFDDEGR